MADISLLPTPAQIGAATTADGQKAQNSVQYVGKSGVTASIIQASINAAASSMAVLTRLTGSVALDGNVIANGRFPSFDIDPGTTFTGVGTIPAFGSPSFYNPIGKNIHLARVKGSPTAPITTEKDPVASFVKFTNFDPAVVPGINAAIAAINYVYSTAPSAAGCAVFGECVDPTGWAGAGGITFVEGGRFHGICTPDAVNGSAYGAVLSGMIQGGKTFKVVAGVEAEANLYGHSASQPAWQSFNPGLSYAVAYNATASGDVSIDALYATNPFMTKTKSAAAGFAVTNNSVWDRAFASNAVCNVGMDLSLGSYSAGAIMMPNNQDIKGRNAAGSGYVSIAYVDTSNRPVIGNGATQVLIPPGIYTGGDFNFGGNLVPTADNAKDIGIANSYRVRNTFLANNPTVTSDQRLKLTRGELTAAEIAAARSIPVKVFQYLDAVAEKGEAGARLHIGVIAQEVVSAFEAQGLDPWRYGLIGKDAEVRRVSKKRTVSVPVTEDYDEQYVDFVEKDGSLVLTNLTRPAQRMKTRELPLVDEAGEPVMGPFPEVDTDGNPVYEEAQVYNEKTNSFVTVRRQKKSQAQMFRSVPVMQDVEEEYFEDELTGEDILSVRYEQLAMFMIAAMRN